MKKNKKKKSVIKIITSIIAVPTLGTAIYIMAHGLGLIDSLDFGAGAYYYADIPDFNKYINGGQYVSEIPMWVIILLFLIWGFVMYRLWVWLDKRP
jgi:Na+/H+ antiporter NhaC